ncbi:MAG: winged helix-turn-helix transcriptional regulator [Solirubrobacteraceae bacterium]
MIAHPCPRAGHRAALALTADGWSTTPVESVLAAKEQICRRRCDLLVVAADFERLLHPARRPTIVLAPRGVSQGRLLDLGADAVCAEPPLREAELCVRARSLVRWPHGLQVDLRRQRATLDDVELSLTAKEFALIAALAASPGDLQTRPTLGHCLWDAERPRDPSRAIDAHVARLKRKLGGHRGLIETVWGLGYRLALPSPPGRSLHAAERVSDATARGPR